MASLYRMKLLMKLHDFTETIGDYSKVNGEVIYLYIVHNHKIKLNVFYDDRHI